MTHRGSEKRVDLELLYCLMQLIQGNPAERLQVRQIAACCYRKQATRARRLPANTTTDLAAGHARLQ
jgi:hypothetical protein